MNEIFFSSLCIEQPESGADLGGGGGEGGGGEHFSLGSRPEDSPLCTIFRYPVLATDPKNFLKAGFEGGILVQSFPKSAQKRLFWPVFSKICLRRRKFGQNRDKTVLWQSSENQFGRPKKSSTNFSKVLKICPPGENPRSAPDQSIPIFELR